MPGYRRLLAYYHLKTISETVVGSVRVYRLNITKTIAFEITGTARTTHIESAVQYLCDGFTLER